MGTLCTLYIHIDPSQWKLTSGEAKNTKNELVDGYFHASSVPRHNRTKQMGFPTVGRKEKEIMGKLLEYYTYCDM